MLHLLKAACAETIYTWKLYIYWGTKVWNIDIDVVVFKN